MKYRHMDNIVVAKVALLLQESILKKEINGASPMTIVTKGMELMETFPNMSGAQKKELLTKVIERVAAGKDGIVGTDDDIIPKECVEALKLMLEKQLLEGIVSVISDAARGKFNLNKAMVVTEDVKKICLPACFALFSRKSKYVAKGK